MLGVLILDTMAMGRARHAAAAGQVALVPYVLVVCSESPLALLTGFIAGSATGAVLGGGAAAT